jgi:group I intron endonuclease
MKADYSGIYCITLAGKVYIGASKHIEMRWHEHLKLLNRGRHKNIHLQNSYNKYGSDSLQFMILCLCSIDDLENTEYLYINLYDSCNRVFGYNLMNGGMGFSRLSDETRARMSDSHRRLWKDKEHREKMCKIRSDSSCRSKISSAQKKTWSDDEYRKKRKKIANSEAHLLKVGKLGRESWNKDETRTKRMAGINKSWGDESVRKRRRIAQEIAYKNPELIDKRREAMRVRWQNPEYKLRVGNKIREALLKRNTTSNDAPSKDDNSSDTAEAKAIGQAAMTVPGCLGTGNGR